MVKEGYEMKSRGISRGSSLFSDPQEQLRAALTQRDLRAFRRHLNSGSVDIEHCYEYPDYKTCLELACSERGTSEYVKLLLNENADVNKVNDTHAKSPLHFAAETGDVNIIKALLGKDDLDINILSKGNTALHLAIKQIDEIETDDRESRLKDYEDIIELLVKAGIDVNIPDQKNVTPVHSAAKQGLENVVKIMIDYSENPIDLDSYKDRRQKTARTMIQTSFPHLLERLSKNASSKEVVNIHKLFSHLSGHDEDKFLKDFEKIKKTDEFPKLLGDNNGLYTLLQFACNNGMDRAVTVLLENGADPNATAPGNDTKPIAIASCNGYHKILNILLSNSKTSTDAVNGESLLQMAIKEEKNNQHDKNCDYKECIKMLLENTKECNINYLDVKDNTALHYAARSGDQDTVLTLLRKGACIGIRNKFNEPPLADISAKTLETFLDECLTTNSERPNDEDYEIQFDYSFLVPPNNANDRDSIKIPLMDDSNGKINDNDQFLAPETDALLYMTRHSELKPLLKHPVITSFLYLKWQRISCLFYANITFYSLFWLSLILHILFGFNPSDEKSDIATTVAQVTRILTITGLVVLIMRETIQITVSPKKYLKSIENWLELFLIIVTCMIMFRELTPDNPMQELFSIAILLSSAELVLIIGQFPALSTNIVMLKTVSWNFFKFLLWYCILIIAFALSFYTLFRTVKTKDDENGEKVAFDPNKKNDEEEEKETDFFLDPGMSLFKTIVMLTGELDASDINFGLFPVTSHVIFIIFVFMIPIVLFNLLNGLAVSDTQAIKADAELVGHISRIQLISYFENIVLGDMSPYRNAISRIQNCCCWLPGRMCINPRLIISKPFARKICLFPNFLPMAQIGVKTNQLSRIVIFTNDRNKKKQSSDDDVGTTLCCLNDCKQLRMDRKIVKMAKAIVSERMSEGSDMKIIQNELSECKKKLEQFEEMLSKIYESVKIN
ncbi:transient receptor potential cation channel family member painless [Arctopsyche grandis]|uniref:transient receptor potential cation channel family member painless n=1 Tax=Arctopsyche grandis TaxID=121162 RepID=UPI00406D6816